MAKKNQKVTQAEVNELAKVQVRTQEEKDPEAEIQTFEIKQADALKGSEEFDPRSNLRSVANGVWRYICKDVSKVKEEVFESDLAKQYGIKSNDLVYLVAQKKHKIVVV